MSLSQKERDVLDFEREWPVAHEHSSKRDVIRSRFGISASRYYAFLAALIDSDDAAAYDPLVVRRARRQRDMRRRAIFRPDSPRKRGPH